jgi:hypothetical protein
MCQCISVLLFIPIKPTYALYFNMYFFYEIIGLNINH